MNDNKPAPEPVEIRACGDGPEDPLGPLAASGHTDPEDRPAWVDEVRAAKKNAPPAPFADEEAVVKAAIEQTFADFMPVIPNGNEYTARLVYRVCRTEIEQLRALLRDIARCTAIGEVLDQIDEEGFYAAIGGRPEKGRKA